MPRFFEQCPSPGALQIGSGTAARLALLVGNSAYSKDRLKNPTRDVALLASILRDFGFDVREVTDATKLTFDREIVDFGGKIAASSPETLALFYFAGHGLQYEGQNYLLPVDAALPDLHRLKSDAVALSYLLDEFTGRAGASVIVLDACRVAPDFATRRPLDGKIGLAPVNTLPNGALIAYSTAAGSIADDGDGDNSPYATALASHLVIPGLSLREVFHRTADTLHKLSRGTQNAFLAAQVFPDVVLSNATTPLPTVTPIPSERRMSWLINRTRRYLQQKVVAEVGISIWLAAAITIVAACGTLIWSWTRQDPPLPPSGEGRVLLSAVACNEEPNLRSMGTSQQTSVRFENKTTQLRRIEWIAHDGSRVLYSRLAAGHAVGMSTYVGHPWIVADEQSRCQAIYLPDPRPAQVTITK